MGIVNVTPDSFSDGGVHVRAERAEAAARRMLDEGAVVVDVGGESTRPGAEPVSLDEELRRVVPVLEGLQGLPVSIDTTKAEVARRAATLGAVLVNDVTALRADPELAGLCAERRCEVVLMHMLGDPRTMQEDPRYDDVVEDVRAFLAERIEAAIAAGIEEKRIWIDPGIGFGKTIEHNIELLRRLGQLQWLGRPILVGTSRKRFIGAITGREVDQRVGGTVAADVLALANGADALRVHDVAATRDTLRTVEAILEPRA